jgi:hypothetical protein
LWVVWLLAVGYWAKNSEPKTKNFLGEVEKDSKKRIGDKKRMSPFLCPPSKTCPLPQHFEFRLLRNSSLKDNKKWCGQGIGHLTKVKRLTRRRNLWNL